MQVLFPAAFIVQSFVSIPVHWFSPPKPCIFNEEEGELTLFTKKSNFFTFSPPCFAFSHFYCFPTTTTTTLLLFSLHYHYHHHYHISTTTFFLKWWQTTQRWVETVALQWRNQTQIQWLNTDTGGASSSKHEDDDFRNSDKKHTYPSPHTDFR